MSPTLSQDGFYLARGLLTALSPPRMAYAWPRTPTQCRTLPQWNNSRATGGCSRYGHDMILIITIYGRCSRYGLIVIIVSLLPLPRWNNSRASLLKLSLPQCIPPHCIPLYTTSLCIPPHCHYVRPLTMCALSLCIPPHCIPPHCAPCHCVNPSLYTTSLCIPLIVNPITV